MAATDPIHDLGSWWGEVEARIPSIAPLRLESARKSVLAVLEPSKNGRLAGSENMSAWTAQLKKRSQPPLTQFMIAAALVSLLRDGLVQCENRIFRISTPPANAHLRQQAPPRSA